MLENKWATGLLALALLGTACRKKHDPVVETESDSVPTTASAPTPKIVPLPGGTVGVLTGIKPKLFRIPLEPRLAILPGQGLGPVRFGATVETVERLLGAKCSEKTETLCRMWGHAIDFVFKDGVVVEMRVQGDQRPFSDKADDTYGTFNGGFVGDAALGMYPPYVIQVVGEPSRVEKVARPETQRFPTVERHYYEDMVLEYDLLKNGNVVLAGVILTRPAAGTRRAVEPAAGGAASAKLNSGKKPELPALGKAGAPK